jgi:phage terminase large subunit
MNDRLTLTTAMKKIRIQLNALTNEKPYAVQEGGAGAGKTISDLLWLIDRCIAVPNLKVFIVSGHLAKMRESVVYDFVRVLKMTGNFYEQFWTGGEHGRPKYRFPNGSFVSFFGVQDGMGAGRRVDYIYINEANLITYKQFRDIEFRAKKILIDYNPVRKFWVHQHLMAEGKSNYSFLRLTFNDNECAVLSEVAKLYEAKRLGEAGDLSEWNRWVTLGLGLPGLPEGVVFPSIKQVEVIPDGAKLLGYGIDFGFSDAITADPTTVVEVSLRGKEMYCRELLYKRGVGMDDLAEFLKTNCPNRDGFMVGDGGGGGALAVSELRRRGVPIIPAVKGPESIGLGIKLMKEYEMYLTEDSINILNEQSMYCYHEITNKPIDKHNHGFDAWRYVALTHAAGANRGGGIASSRMTTSNRD